MAHRREISHDDRRRVPIPRRTTRGPLDDDDPLTDQESALVSPPPSLSTPINTILPGTSPPPSSASQLLSSDLSPPARVSARHTSSASFDRRLTERPKKDFSFLFNTSIYQSLPATSVAPPFQHSPHQPQLHTPLHDLLAHGHFRVAATSCVTMLTSGTVSPHDSTTIFSLFLTRLSCLLLLQLTPLAAAESKALGDLTSSFYREPGESQHVVPWELRVLCVRLQALGFGDARRGIMGYYELGREARQQIGRLLKAKRDVEGEKKMRDVEEEVVMWKNRLRDLGVRVADALIEMGDLEGATRYLASQQIEGDADEIQRARMALIWLRVGDVKTAQRILGLGDEGVHVEQSEKAIMSALIKVADGDYEGALTIWQKLREQIPENEMVYQNLAVCLLYTGRISEARSLLEALIDKPASFHALTFNLSTIYELCTEYSRDRKMELADRVATHKPSQFGWEKSAADFKL